jgi:ADP-heptose:LPS heptosyltransferase
MIISTGTINAIARGRPNVALDVLASPMNAPVLAGNRHLHEVLVFDTKRVTGYLPAIRRLRRRRYDVVIDCTVTGPSMTNLLLMLASGARYRIGVAGRGVDGAFSVTVPPVRNINAHMIDRLASLARGFGLELTAEQRQPVIVLSDAELAAAEAAWGDRQGGRRALINVSAGTPARSWPESKYAQVMRHLRERHGVTHLSVIGAPAERARAERVAGEGRGRFVATPTIRDAFALVATSDFVLTPDTSIAHAASAFRKPAVAMFTRGVAARWALYGTLGESLEHADRHLDTLSADRATVAVDAVFRRLSEAAVNS